MEYFKRIANFIKAMKYAMNPPPEYHERLARNLHARIEQEKIREQWIEIWSDSSTEESDLIDGIQSEIKRTR